MQLDNQILLRAFMKRFGQKVQAGNLINYTNKLKHCFCLNLKYTRKLQLKRLKYKFSNEMCEG